MKRLKNLLIAILLIAITSLSLFSCSVVEKPNDETVKRDFLTYLSVDGTLPFSFTVQSFTVTGTTKDGAYIADIEAEIASEYAGASYQVILYKAALKYSKDETGKTALDYVMGYSNTLLSGFDLPTLFAESKWDFDPLHNFGHSAARNEKAGLPAFIFFGMSEKEEAPEETPEETPEEKPEETPEGSPEETPAATPEESEEDTAHSFPLELGVSAEIHNHITATYYATEMYSEDLGVALSWDFKVTYATNNSLYLDFLHLAGTPVDDIAGWIIVTRPTSSVKAEVVFKLAA